ncbi:MAG: DUF6702 family protein [Bacteroidota bacterium]
MKYVVFLCSFLLGNHLLHAHEVNEAFFTIKKQGDQIVVETEVPWTLRNALLAFDPKLEHATSKQEFESTFFRYIQQNLIIVDAEGNIVPLIGFKELERSGHSHQNDLILWFGGTTVAKITNTVMFNIYDDQVNYTSININEERRTFRTKKGKSVVIIDQETREHRIFFPLLAVFVLITGLLLYIKDRIPRPFFPARI